MKKYMSSLLILLGSFLLSFTATAQKSKAYVKFEDPRVKKLHATKIGSTDILVKFKSKKEATIYLELIKDGKIVAGENRTLKSKQGEVLTMKLKKFKSGILTATTGYVLKVSCYEGPKNVFKTRIGEIDIVKNVRLSRL